MAGAVGASISAMSRAAAVATLASTLSPPMPNGSSAIDTDRTRMLTPNASGWVGENARDVAAQRLNIVKGHREEPRFG